MRYPLLTLGRSAKAAILAHASPRHRQFLAQRNITDPGERVVRASRLARSLPAAVSSAASEDGLERDGYAFVPGLVTPEQVAAIRAHFRDRPARDRRREHLGSFTAPEGVPPETHVADYRLADVLAAPHLLTIANHPRVIAAVSAFLGAKPTLAGIRVWWSTPTPSGEPEEVELFHRDVDDLRFVKLFVYLSDVDETSGPHVYAAGSHRLNALTEIRRYSDAEVRSLVGDGAIKHFTGPAGTAFLVNTYGLHRGLPPVSKPRLVFQPLYTLRPSVYAPLRPLRARRDDEAGLDPYVNRLFVEQCDRPRSRRSGVPT